MQFSFFIAGLIGVLMGTRLRARALVLICAATFVATLIATILMGWSYWASIGAAFGLSFTVQAFYLVGLVLVFGKNELVKRFAALAESEQHLPRRIGKTVS
jgi:hypothetical protein